MNEIILTKMLELAKTVPREALGISEEIFRPERSQDEVFTRLQCASEIHSGFEKIARELRQHQSCFSSCILVLRSSLLTRSRYSVHSPKAVCTMPGSRVTGYEETLTESLRLIRSAKHSIYLMSYWMTGGSDSLLNVMMEQAIGNPSLKIVLVGDSRRNFLEPFDRMWRKEVTRPVVYIYKPGLNSGSEDRSKMHAKTLIADETKMLITSANMTRLAMAENIEVGISIEAPKAVRKISLMINELIHNAALFERA